ncbi:MAG: adenosylcobinamide-GDP ribazoletransferase [Deltaproteobacteria bacterium]|jgi:adenosylcobinamide-GDP ribazoletransferase|nr:adenosylcobinamide-GDP ribazoletransferase [Deltaproteobacteria bacterium]MCL5880250.1 adenosylcobinamide-GDP ribazoletransferase [Deltaproteobacteria bacterium]MDA8303564.1 adenosylcobinamide-GDP ribazoletransferase [Deltaproteobacteria bacterium]
MANGRIKQAFIVSISNLSEAVNFLTIFRLRKKNKADGNNNNADKDNDLAVTKLTASIKYFPLAGLFIGAILAFTFYIFDKFLPDPASALMPLLFLFILTGGLHFDGLSDTADGLFAYLKSGDKNRFYNAMKDVNTGTSGIIAVIFYILIMWIAINGINFRFIYLSLLTFPVIGRYSIVLMSYFSNTPEDFKGIGTIFTEGTKLRTFIAASIFTVIIVYIFFKLAGIFSALISTLFILAVAFYFAKKFGGVNGDMLGFSVKISEAVYMVALHGFYKVLF